MSKRSARLAGGRPGEDRNEESLPFRRGLLPIRSSPSPRSRRQQEESNGEANEDDEGEDEDDDEGDDGREAESGKDEDEDGKDELASGVFQSFRPSISHCLPVSQARSSAAPRQRSALPRRPSSVRPRPAPVRPRPTPSSPRSSPSSPQSILEIFAPVGKARLAQPGATETSLTWHRPPPHT